MRPTKYTHLHIVSIIKTYICKSKKTFQVNIFQLSSCCVLRLKIVKTKIIRQKQFHNKEVNTLVIKTVKIAHPQTDSVHWAVMTFR